MASTYTPRNRWELIGNGETGNEASWDLTINEQIGLIEDSVSGIAAITMTDADKTLSTANGGEDEARHAVIALSGGSLTTTRNVICPAVEKLYVVSNATTGGQSIVFKTASGTGITVPNGSKKLVYCDGTNVVDMVNDLPSGARLNGTAFGTAAVVADSSLAHLAGTETFTGAKTFANTGLLVQDTDASHALTLKWNENSSAARTLNITGLTGADQTLNVSTVVYPSTNGIAWTGTAHSFSNAFSVSAQGTRFGSPSGNSTSPTNTNTNILLYNNSSTNYAGFGVDSGGSIYLVCGTSSPKTQFFMAHDGRVGWGTNGVGSISKHTDIGDAGTAWQYGASINGTTVFYCYNHGNVGVYLTTGQTTWAASSDERIKNIRGGLEGDSLAMVRALMPIRYTLKSDDAWAAIFGGTPQERISFGAAHTLAVMPEVVDVPELYDPDEPELNPMDPDYLRKVLGVRQPDMIPRLVHALQQMADMADALRARVEALEAAQGGA